MNQRYCRLGYERARTGQYGTRCDWDRSNSGAMAVVEDSHLRMEYSHGPRGPRSADCRAARSGNVIERIRHLNRTLGLRITGQVAEPGVTDVQNDVNLASTIFWRSPDL